MQQKIQRSYGLILWLSAILSIKWASIFSAIVTLVIVVWEWLENPGGIFRGAGGTQWQFVYDTAISWFLPTFIYSIVVVFIAATLYSAVKIISQK
ncbi:hypothetical protein JK628_15140 [Shewanella sp. KX20019]|uniref:hypothetical protein n=1 Tax=Shewanella sp. KX20019 TaxID=2803864 RepID=UPI001926EDD2|nr:hypothetical protein [Shewanella sp. KX20019]QQX78892.1 hypothetical protein JK628_15140 [Shewanella sp. KX20019]